MCDGSDKYGKQVALQRPADRRRPRDRAGAGIVATPTDVEVQGFTTFSMTNEPLQQEDFEVLAHYGRVVASVQQFELVYDRRYPTST
jgi:hypothetical protein